MAGLDLWTFAPSEREFFASHVVVTALAAIDAIAPDSAQEAE